MANPALGEGMGRALLAVSVAWAPFVGCMDFDQFDHCARERCAGEAHDGGLEASGPAANDAGDGEIFASAQPGVFGLARDASTLYWTSAPPNGRVASCPLASCATPTVIASGASPSAIAWGSRAIWTDDRDASLHFVKDGNGVGALDMGQPSLWVTADVDTYVVQKNGTIVKLVSDPPTQRTTFLSFSTVAERASTRGGAVAWTENDGSVHACVNGGCASRAASVVAAAAEGATGVALDDGLVFWTTKDGRIRSAPRTATSVGSGLVDVASGLTELAAIAPDPKGASIYFSARGTSATGYTDGVVGKVPKSGGAVTLLARGQARPEGILVTETHVYWADSGDGTIRRAPK